MVAKLELLIHAKDEASRVLGDVDKNAGGLSKTLGGPLKLAGIAAAGAIGGLGALLISSVKDAAEAEQQMDQLEAVLKSTAGAAGITKKGALDLATALSKQSTFTDDAVLSAENLLLTFTNIKGPIFEGATQAVLDMSAALGQDLKSSSIQVGKALNDPIEGVSALQRVGVSFTDAQKEVIKTLVETGDVAGAQKLILQELTTEFGGQASAQTEGFAGKMVQLKNAFGEAKEALGAQLLPMLTNLATWAVEHQEEIKKAITDTIQGGKQAFLDLKDAGEKLKPVLDGLVATYQAMPKPIQDATLAVGALTAGLIALNVAGVPVVALLKNIGIAAGFVGGLLTATASLLLLFLGPLTLVAAGLYLLGIRFSDVKNIVSDFIGFIGAVPGAVKNNLTGPFEDARDAVSWLIRRIEALIDAINSIPSLPDIPTPGGIFGKVGGIFKQAGGPVFAGHPYIVGEKGPEWFVPKVAGEIVANNAIAAIGGGERVLTPAQQQGWGGGDVHITIENINLGRGVTHSDVRTLTAMIKDQWREDSRRGL